MAKENINQWSEEKLRRKLDQAHSMRGLALRDNDPEDAARHFANVKRYAEELRSRRE